MYSSIVDYFHLHEPRGLRTGPPLGVLGWSGWGFRPGVRTHLNIDFVFAFNQLPQLTRFHLLLNSKRSIATYFFDTKYHFHIRHLWSTPCIDRQESTFTSVGIASPYGIRSAKYRRLERNFTQRTGSHKLKPITRSHRSIRPLRAARTSRRVPLNLISHLEAWS